MSTSRRSILRLMTGTVALFCAGRLAAAQLNSAEPLDIRAVGTGTRPADTRTGAAAHAQAPARTDPQAALTGARADTQAVARTDALTDPQAAAASAHFPFGPVVPPVPVPAWPVRTNDSRLSNLQSLLHGHVTALQLMFTGCGSTCPIQGAVFAAAQRHLGSSVPQAQFLSLSIAPEADTPKALDGWLHQFDAGPGWVAAAPRREDLAPLTALLRGETGLRSGPQLRAGDAHTAQVYIVDAQGLLVYRSANFPPADRIAGAIRHYAPKPMTLTE